MANPVRQASYQSPSIGGPAGNFPAVNAGWFIRGYAIDNLSGSWLYNPATGQYIAPYTLGFASSLRPAVSSLTIQYITVGPGGQASSALGQPFSLTIYDSPILNAPGTPFLNPDGTPLTQVSVATTKLSFVQATNIGYSGSGGWNLVAVLPVSPKSGNHLLLIGSNTAGSPGSFTPPVGWTILQNTMGSAGGTCVLYKLSNGTEQNTALIGNLSGGTPQIGFIVAEYTSIKGLRVGFATAVGATTVMPNPSVSPTSTPVQTVLMMLQNIANSTVSAAPNLDALGYTATVSGAAMTAFVGDKAYTAPGAETPGASGAFTASASSFGAAVALE